MQEYGKVCLELVPLLNLYNKKSQLIFKNFISTI